MDECHSLPAPPSSPALSVCLSSQYSLPCCLHRALSTRVHAALVPDRSSVFPSTCTDHCLFGKPKREEEFNCRSPSTYTHSLARSPFTMPPRKKQKATEATEAENGHASPNTPAPRDSASKPDTDYDLVADPWTDEQETALLKAIIKWKPVGSFGFFLSHLLKWRLGELIVVDAVNKRHTQTLSHDRYLRIHEESRLCALARRTYAHSRNLEKAQYTLQSPSTG